MKEKEIYFDFPICLLPKLLEYEDKKEFFQDVVKFAKYAFIRDCKQKSKKWISENSEEANNIANDFFSVKGGSILLGEPIYKEVSNLYLNNVKSAKIYTSLKTETLWNLHNGTDFSENCYNLENNCIDLLAYLAIKSILAKGRTPFIKTNFDFIFSRMNGNAGTTNPKEWNDVIYNCNTRRKKERLRNSLEYNWHVGFYSCQNMRGFYISTMYNSQELAEKILEKYPDKKQKSKLDAVTSEKYNELIKLLGEEKVKQHFYIK